MGTLLRDCKLYLEPELDGSSPTTPSRVIDILYDEDLVTSHSTKYTKSWDFLKSFEEEEDSVSPLECTSETKWLLTFSQSIEGTSLDRI